MCPLTTPSSSGCSATASTAGAHHRHSSLAAAALADGLPLGQAPLAAGPELLLSAARPPVPRLACRFRQRALIALLRDLASRSVDGGNGEPFADMRAAFQRMDTDADGLVSYAEVRAE